MRSEEIKLADFYEQVMSQRILKGLDVIPEQIREALAGLSNLYLEACLKTGKGKLTVDTYNGFASDVVPEESIHAEIMNCSGLPSVASYDLRVAMTFVLESIMGSYESAAYEMPIIFRPLGALQALDLKEARYRIFYRDPALDQYHSLYLEESQ